MNWHLIHFLLLHLILGSRKSNIEYGYHDEHSCQGCRWPESGLFTGCLPSNRFRNCTTNGKSVTMCILCVYHYAHIVSISAIEYPLLNTIQHLSQSVTQSGIIATLWPPTPLPSRSTSWETHLSLSPPPLHSLSYILLFLLRLSRLSVIPPPDFFLFTPPLVVCMYLLPILFFLSHIILVVVCCDFPPDPLSTQLLPTIVFLLLLLAI